MADQTYAKKQNNGSGFQSFSFDKYEKYYTSFFTTPLQLCTWKIDLILKIKQTKKKITLSSNQVSLQQSSGQNTSRSV